MTHMYFLHFKGILGLHELGADVLALISRGGLALVGVFLPSPPSDSYRSYIAFSQIIVSQHSDRLG